MKTKYIGVAYHDCDGQWQGAAIFEGDHDPQKHSKVEHDLKRDWAEVWKEIDDDETIKHESKLPVAYERMRKKGWTVVEPETVPLDMD